MKIAILTGTIDVLTGAAQDMLDFNVEEQKGDVKAFAAYIQPNFETKMAKIKEEYREAVREQLAHLGFTF